MEFKKPIFDWPKLVKNKKKELLRLNEIYMNLLTNSGLKSTRILLNLLTIKH